MRAIKITITALNFEFLIADILEKQRNPASTTFKKIASYKANKLSKDPIRQNKGPKRIKSFKPFNRHKKPDRGSNYNTYFEEDKEVFKNVETEPESDLNLEL